MLFVVAAGPDGGKLVTTVNAVAADGSITFYTPNYDRGICYIAAGIVRPVSDNVVALRTPAQRWTIGYLHNLNLSGLAIFASDSAAGDGRLVAGDLCKTAAGALMIKL